MPYRDDREALRERIEWLEGEIGRAREERDRVPRLEQELGDARERLSRFEGTPADRARRRLRLALALGLGGVALGALGAVVLFHARSVSLADPPPDLGPARPPAEVELDAPPGWTSRTRDVEHQAGNPHRAAWGPDRWTQLTSPDGKARIWFTRVDAASHVRYRDEAMEQLCPGAGALHEETHRIGPDHLPAWYDEGPCAGDRATVVAVDVPYDYPDRMGGPSSTASRDSYEKNHLVLVSRLESECPEPRHLELASMLASIQRKP